MFHWILWIWVWDLTRLLNIAAKNNCLHLMDLLLASSDRDFTENFQSAAFFGHEELVRALLDRPGVDVDEILNARRSLWLDGAHVGGS